RTCRHFRGSAARLLVPVSMDAHVRTGAHQPIDPPEEQPRTSAALELARRLRRGGRMSHKTVQLVIGWLLTDEDLRGRFMAQPRMTLASLRDQGYELTPEEFEAILLCDPTLWASAAQKIHPRLRRVSLH